MIDKNNLNRIKGILSAKKGAEIPKFLNPGGPLTYNAQDPDFIKFTEFSGDRITPFSFRYYAALKSLSPNATPQQLAEQMTGQASLPGNITVSEAVSNYEKNKNILNNSSNNSRSLIETEVPGAPVLNPNSAVETAALDNQIAAMLKREENIKNASLVEPLSTPIHGITVPEPASKNTDVSQLLQKAQTRMKQEAEVEKAVAEKTAAKMEKWEKTGEQAAQVTSAALKGIGDAVGALQTATDSNTTKTVNAAYDAISSGLKEAGGVAGMVGTAMEAADIVGDIAQSMGGGTDLLTTTDKWMDSSFFSWNIGMINGFAGKNSDKFSVDQNMLSQVGSSYGGFASEANEIAKKADKKYGLFSSKERKKVNNEINELKNQQAALSDISNTSAKQKLSVQSMGEQAGLAYSMMTDGGYNQKYTYAAKQGGLLEWNPTLEIEWEPQIEINWELPTFKEGGNIDIIEELEWVPELKNGDKLDFDTWFNSIPKEYKADGYDYKKAYEVFWDLLSKHAKDPKNNHLVSVSPVADENGNFPFLKLGTLDENKELQGEFDWYNSDEGKEHRNKFDIKFINGRYYYVPKQLKQGGSVGDSDIPEIEETSQKNVIPEGALHKNKHHMLHAEGLTKKGIPVIDDNGEQQAEIEHSEIIFTLEVTKKLEEYYKIFYSEESSNKEKELAALDAGKLLVYQILENTEDRTGLIESCKKGGTLTIKESEIVEDLLDWMPTIMIVEEIKEEIEEEKPKKKLELEKDDLKELVKDVIREALIELLIK